MRLIEATLEGDKKCYIHPNAITHLQPLEGRNGCLLWQRGDNLPTILMESYLEVVADFNDAMTTEIDAAGHRHREFFDLVQSIHETLWRLVLVSGIGTGIIIVLLLVLLTRGH